MSYSPEEIDDIAYGLGKRSALRQQQDRLNRAALVDRGIEEERTRRDLAARLSNAGFEQPET